MGIRSNEPRGSIWHQAILVSILSVAACVRFYSLDQVSFSADELKNLANCEIKGWLAMIANYHAYNGGMPPLYPMLLYLVTHLTLDTEFFARSLSAMAGLTAIYFIYITGRDFISPLAGLIAAAVMATELRTILLDRDATLYPLLALWCLIHNYYFCKLFFSSDPHKPLGTYFSATTFHFEWYWRPDYPADAQYLAGFWLSGLAALYTSPMALVLIVSELLVSAYLIKNSGNFTHWRTGMRSLWLPLLIGLLPWLPMAYKNSAWILAGNLFAVQDFSILRQHILNLMPVDVKLQYGLGTLLVIFALTSVIVCIKPALLQQRCPHAKYLCAFIGLQLIIALISIEIILPASQLSYLYYLWIFILTLTVPIVIGIDSIIPSPFLKTTIAGFIVLTITILQLNSNAQYKLYSMGGNGDFRLVAKIIHDDEHFMKGNRNIVSSSNLFEHHLQAEGVITNNMAVLNSDNPVSNINNSSGTTEFYYLEYLPFDRDLLNETAAFQSLASQYKKVCMTRLPWILVVQFSRDPSASDNTAQDCRAHLANVVSL